MLINTIFFIVSLLFTIAAADISTLPYPFTLTAVTKSNPRGINAGFAKLVSTSDFTLGYKSAFTLKDGVLTPLQPPEDETLYFALSPREAFPPRFSLSDSSVVAVVVKEDKVFGKYLQLKQSKTSRRVFGLAGKLKKGSAVVSLGKLAADEAGERIYLKIGPVDI